MIAVNFHHGDEDYMSKKRVTWTRDEIILACEIVRRNSWDELNEDDTEVRKLSDLLRRSPQHPLSIRGEDFRSPGSVSRKTADIATRHPKYGIQLTKEGKLRKPTKGGKLDGIVLQDFLDNEDKMKSVAAHIRQGIVRGDFDSLPNDEESEDEDYHASEGRLLRAHHFKRERDPKLRRRKIKSVVDAGRPIACEACGFDYGQVYGDRGNGYIEVHHVRPLHDSGPVVTRLNDLVMLCANCHRMVHRGAEWLTPEELREHLCNGGPGQRGRTHHSGWQAGQV